MHVPTPAVGSTHAERAAAPPPSGQRPWPHEPGCAAARHPSPPGARTGTSWWSPPIVRALVDTPRVDTLLAAWASARRSDDAAADIAARAGGARGLRVRHASHRAQGPCKRVRLPLSRRRVAARRGYTCAGVRQAPRRRRLAHPSGGAPPKRRKLPIFSTHAARGGCHTRTASHLRSSAVCDVLAARVWQEEPPRISRRFTGSPSQSALPL